MRFEQPQDLASIIKVIGVGGGGSNAVNHMFAQGIKGVDFLVCNTDKQALDISPVPNRLQLGIALTEGLGAGSVPERGKDAAQENIEQIKQLLSQRTKMVFITAGMGGGTGTGAAPVIARVAREMGVLTVGIVTLPFNWEGRKRRLQAQTGIEEMRQAVDTLLIINNDRLRDLYGNLSLDNAFMHADNVLTTAARGIAEVITITGKVNVDFEDVKTVMTNSGVAIMGMSEAEGEDRALRAAKEALASPLLNDNDIKGAKYVLLNITHGEKEVLMDEIAEITDHIQDAAGSTADVIWGYCHDAALGHSLRVTLIATGFDRNPEIGGLPVQQPERKVIPLETPMPTEITRPIAHPVTGAPKPPAPAVPRHPWEPYLKPVAPQAAPPDKPAPAPPVPVSAPSIPAKEQQPEPYVKIVAPAPPPPPKPVEASRAKPATIEKREEPAPAAAAPAAPPAPKVEPTAIVPAPPVEEVPPVAAAIPEPVKVIAPEVEAVDEVVEERTPPLVIEPEPAPALPVAQTPPTPAVKADPPPAVPDPKPVEKEWRPERGIIFETPYHAPKPAPVASTPPPPEEKKVFSLHDEAPVGGTEASASAPPAPAAPTVQHERGVEDRLARIRELTLKLRSPSGLADLEKEPAYKRKNVTLSGSPHSSDSSVSRYTLTEETDENGEKRVELKRNNPYLHDNVD